MVTAIGKTIKFGFPVLLRFIMEFGVMLAQGEPIHRLLHGLVRECMLILLLLVPFVVLNQMVYFMVPDVIHLLICMRFVLRYI